MKTYTQDGVLVLADISGFTEFVTATELEHGPQIIANRMNIEGVLKTDSEPDTYTAVYAIYRSRAEEVVGRLRALPVPDRVHPVHERIVRAAERQIEFYGDFTAARARDGSTDLARMLGHPALRESDYDLRAAWDLIRQTYPDLAPAMLQTIEAHLCRFDAI